MNGLKTRRLAFYPKQGNKIEDVVLKQGMYFRNSFLEARINLQKRRTGSY